MFWRNLMTWEGREFWFDRRRRKKENSKKHADKTCLHFSRSFLGIHRVCLDTRIIHTSSPGAVWLEQVYAKRDMLLFFASNQPYLGLMDTYNSCSLGEGSLHSILKKASCYLVAANKESSIHSWQQIFPFIHCLREWSLKFLAGELNFKAEVSTILYFESS